MSLIAVERRVVLDPNPTSLSPSIATGNVVVMGGHFSLPTWRSRIGHFCHRTVHPREYNPLWDPPKVCM